MRKFYTKEEIFEILLNLIDHLDSEQCDQLVAKVQARRPQYQDITQCKS